ncbi:ubiquinol-cytochrome C reductase [Sphingomonas sp. Leaf23]|uniref:ABC1 kinase family protein n=1 Tax=Sphingomonas sp. Leaf23 TaxID=1735689 RepID=UPI0006FB3ECD|nr:AarF/ABC1/UbiB kinase family protein [Sphingomonas sp. Leaf23]KQM81647.1 ubiquinol-cytochrome C reductase [Sphingomonas sp. Leaf23]
MTDEPLRPGRAVPSGRLSRLSGFGRLAGGIAGGMLAEGARRIASGERPRMGDLILTPANAKRMADRLSHLRGAAMKLGQMISMDAGDLLPPELATILAQLRNQGQTMPPAQLDKLLIAEWGPDWRGKLAKFDANPIAAASIGQVHRAELADGRRLAIKVQYPGVRESIDADVDNVATLLRVSNLLPRELDLKPLLAEAKRQLADEADYAREADAMRRYADRLAGDPRYAVPRPVEALTTTRILAMDYIDGTPIEGLATAPQPTRDAAMTALIDLCLRELFDFGEMQTDPNFANYRWQADSRRIVLLDFGATRGVPADTANAYARLIAAGLAHDRDTIRDVAVETGFLGAAAVRAHRAAVDRIIAAIDDAMARPGPFDFGDRAFVPVVREEAKALAADRATWHVPHVETLFVQRKISGTALLGARLKARVDVRGMAAEATGRRVDM